MNSDGTAAGSSHRQILRSSSIIGGASVINIAMGLLRQKAAALILGPAGVGLIGLYQSLIATAAALGALGLGNAGSRQVAAAVGREDAHALAGARRALFWVTSILALLSAVLLWLFRGTVARLFFANPSFSPAIGWLGVAVGLSIFAGSQIALLTGMRRIGDVARVSIISSLLTTVAGIGALMALGREGVLVFVIATPLAAVVVGLAYVARLPRSTVRTSWPSVKPQARMMILLGIPIMIGGFAGLGGQTMARILVQHAFGLTELGYFQAAATLSITYLGFVLHAMGTDYYPRLTAVIQDHGAAVKIVNEQSEVAILLAGPMLIGMMGASPWILQLLYSADFYPAAPILQWHILGDLLKIVSWPLGFILLAKGDGRTYMLTEIGASALFVFAIWLGLPLIGIEAAGIAYFALYLVYVAVVYALGRHKIGFRWSRNVKHSFAVLAAGCFSVFFLAQWNEYWAAAAAAAGSLSFGWWAFGRLSSALGGSFIDKLLRRGKA